MSSTTATPTTALANRNNATARRVAARAGGAVVLAGLTWLGANIRIPIEPVPVTLQTLFVLLAGAVLGRSWGALSQTLYVGAGAIGAPVFAGAVGLAVLYGPTGGYLAGFIVAPLIIGKLLPRARSLAGQAAVFAIGTLVIFALGVTHLGVFYTHGVTSALMAGFVPFIPGAVFKIVAAVSIYRSYTQLAHHAR